MSGAGRGEPWSPFRPLGLASPLSPEILAEILDGGQSFRWHKVHEGLAGSAVAGGADPGERCRPRTRRGQRPRPQSTSEVWEGGWASFRARLRLDEAGVLEWSAPTARIAETKAALQTYWDTTRDARLLADTLPWRSDPHLARAIRDFPGLQILRQPFGETLLTFLCSTAKQIVQIKQIAAALSRPYGRLPTWAELAATSEADLRACKLGFRARHVHRTAQHLAANPGWLEATEVLPYPEAKERLLGLSGVGEKVADCVLLFGAGRLEAFPVDVWILNAMNRRYGLQGWSNAQLAHFGRMHFGPLAGLAQQYLFAWERKNG